MNLRRFFLCFAIVSAVSASTVCAQDPVPVGRGSYASFPPLVKGRSDAHWGDLSTLMQSKKLWVDELPDRPIPTNDWWTGLINAPFADALWSYPAMVHPSSSGITVNYPVRWNDNGTEVVYDTSLSVGADGFAATEARARSWHDWDVEMFMPGAKGGSMLVTLAHGSPFTWVEMDGDITPRITASAVPVLFDATGAELTAQDLERRREPFVGLRVGGDCYGVYYAEGSRPTLDGAVLRLDAPAGGKVFVVVALLPTAAHLAEYAQAATAVPRDTRVDWSYDERRGEIRSTWTVDATDLRTGRKACDVLQGFLPHAYKGAVRAPQFTADSYLTPRGTMRMASGRSFEFVHTFAGMLPWYPHPSADDSADHPYRPDVMAGLIDVYARRGTFGDDTYWGGKGLVQMALNMTFAKQAGLDELFELSRVKLRDKLVDWLTYTPGEERVYFAFYPRWGGLVGEDTSYDSDTFNDHHFHYGYFTLAGAMLCMVDDEFRRDYGPMLRLVAKDYANWDRSDTRFPFLRTLDPWVGHSYAGGLGDQGNSNGNGQESSSEAMQGWGGVYLLGVALDDREMRDAGIFGWATEARATREYWFDVDARFDRHGQGGNFDHDRYRSPYNTNITCKGIGWWTWFSGDPLHMHGIQWMPVSPALDYMSWDPDFVRWAYNDLMTTPGWGHKWFEAGTNPEGAPLEPLANDDWGNVVLSYMQRAMPHEAAAIFDEALERGSGIATAVSTGHISYYIIHSHLTYGPIDWTVHADIPSANAYLRSDGTATYAVWNPGDERDVTFYRGDEAVRTVRAPGHAFTVFAAESRPERLAIEAEGGPKFPASAIVKATAYDQYGATVAGVRPAWTVAPATAGSIAPDGTFTFAASLPMGASATVTASWAGLDASLTLTKAEAPRVAAIRILPDIDFIEKGNTLTFSAEVLDQYGRPIAAELTWTLDGVSTTAAPALDGATPGRHTARATAGGVEAERSVMVTPRLPNMARGCAATVSSTENDALGARNLTDGDTSTRWGSRHADGEWARIDLGADCHITRVGIMWEAAFASSYLIQVIPDGTPVTEGAWRTVAEVNGLTSAGLHETPVSATARHVRILCQVRASVYGISAYEIYIHGMPLGVAPDTVIGLDVATDALSVDQGDTVGFAALTWTLGGASAPAAVVWTADQGTITPGGTFCAATPGLATITATAASGLAASVRIPVNEVLRMASLQASPAEILLPTGTPVAFALDAADQFGGPYTFDPEDVVVAALDADGQPTEHVTVDLAARTVTADLRGDYTVTFACGTLSARIDLRCVDFPELNLALGRPTETSSQENDGLAGRFAVDGLTSTRWGSRFADGEWIAVDLEDSYYVSRICVTTNDIAYATVALVEGSLDGREWFPLATRTMHAIGTDDFTIPATALRYVRYTGLERATGYGVSVAEIEVYAERPVLSVAPVEAEPTMVDVYTIDGRHVRRAAPADALRDIPAGFYIVNHRKVAVRGAHAAAR